MRWACVLIAAVVFAVVVAEAVAVELEHRWVYVSTNLLVNENVEEVIALMERAKRVGCTGMVLSDSTFGRLPTLD